MATIEADTKDKHEDGAWGGWAYHAEITGDNGGIPTDGWVYLNINPV
jgi:hypothetical protein